MKNKLIVKQLVISSLVFSLFLTVFSIYNNLSVYHLSAKFFDIKSLINCSITLSLIIYGHYISKKKSYVKMKSTKKSTILEKTFLVILILITYKIMHFMTNLTMESDKSSIIAAFIVYLIAYYFLMYITSILIFYLIDLLDSLIFKSNKKSDPSKGHSKDHS